VTDLPTQRSPSRGPLTWACAALLLALVVGVYFPVASFSFVDWDDQETILHNPDFNPVKLESVAGYWAKPHMSLYVPVTYTFWGGIVAATAENGVPKGEALHVANVALQAMATLLVFRLLLTLGAPAVPAGLAAAVFAVHPVQAEPVGWISGGKDLLSGALAIGSLCCYAAWAVRGSGQWQVTSGQSPTRAADAAAMSDVSDAAGSHRGPEVPTAPSALATGHAPPATPSSLAPLLLTAAGVLYALALLAKPSVVTLPIVAAALDRFVLGRPWRESANVLFGGLALAIPVVVVGTIVQTGHALPDTPAWFRPVVAGDALAWYLLHVAWPANLAVDYGRSPGWLFAQPWAYATGAVPVAVGVVVWAARRRAPWLVAAAVTFAAALLPVLGLLPFEFQQYSTVADHYLYLPLLGVSLAVAFGLTSLARRPAGVAAASAPRAAGRQTLLAAQLACVVAVGLLAWRAHEQTYAWRDSESLFAANLEANPTSLAAHRVLGYVATRKGDTALALGHYANALEVRPDDGETLFNLGNLWLKSDPKRAAGYFQAATARLGDDPRVHNNLGIALIQSGDAPGAAEAFRTALRVDPTYADAHLNLALLAARAGDVSAARAHAAQALDLNPKLDRARQLLQQLPR
jgi:tetratricopeptide (TPR) repeat protein